MTPSRILIIDDEKAIRDSFGAHLEDCGYDIITAENGRVGLSLFEKKDPDLVIIDLRMPEVDGIQVLDQISRQSPMTPLIVASGTGIITDAIEALHCGAWEYLLKPIEDLSILTHAVEAALEKAQLKRENQDYRQHLEQLVEARTADLEQANTHLSQTPGCAILWIRHAHSPFAAKCRPSDRSCWKSSVSTCWPPVAAFT